MTNGPGTSGSDAPFVAFVSRFGSPVMPTRADAPNVDHLPRNFPNSIRQLWRLHGFGGYADGLIWTHPPRDFAPVIEEWTGLGPGAASLVVRFSFGDFAMWARERLFFVSVHRGFTEELPEDADFLFDEMLCDDAFLDNFARRPLHAECTRRLGPLLAGECYGFVPALALGGTECAESVQKVQLLEHLAILAQINGPIDVR